MNFCRIIFFQNTARTVALYVRNQSFSKILHFSLFYNFFQVFFNFQKKNEDRDWYSSTTNVIFKGLSQNYYEK